MWFDSHAHLYDFEGNGELEAVIERARAASVTGILCVGTDPETSDGSIRLAAAYDEVYAGAAFHPSEAKGWRDEWAGEIDALLAQPKVVAVGETGLDFHWDTSYVDDQIAMFRAHIGLAKRHEKALVVHTRDSVDSALDELEREGPPARLIFHCWSGELEALERALALGAYVSFAGNVSFKNAPALRAAAARVPIDRLLVETDSPYLAPEPHRGRRNEPALVAHVGSAVAAARGADLAELAAATTANAKEVLGLV